MHLLSQIAQETEPLCVCVCVRLRRLLCGSGEGRPVIFPPLESNMALRVEQIDARQFRGDRRV